MPFDPHCLVALICLYSARASMTWWQPSINLASQREIEAPGFWEDNFDFPALTHAA